MGDAGNVCPPGWNGAAKSPLAPFGPEYAISLEKTMRQKTRIPTDSTVSQKQASLIAALASGSSVTQAAKHAGIDRSTYYAWLKNDAAFLAELNRQYNERTEALWARLSGLADESLAFLDKLLKNPKAEDSLKLKAALEVLRSIVAMKPEGNLETDPDRIRENQKLAAIATRDLMGD